MEEKLNVKAGDKVIYLYPSDYPADVRIVTVKEITSTGNIIIDYNNYQFDKDGYETRDVWFKGRICQENR